MAIDNQTACECDRLLEDSQLSCTRRPGWKPSRSQMAKCSSQAAWFDLLDREYGTVANPKSSPATRAAEVVKSRLTLPVVTAENHPCPHFDAAVLRSVERCTTCGPRKKTSMPVYACRLHEACTIRPVSRDVQSCEYCPDFELARRTSSD